MNIIRRSPRQGARLRRSRIADQASGHQRLKNGFSLGRRCLSALLLLGLSVLLYQQVQQLWDAQKFPLRYVHLQGEWHYLKPAELQQIVLSQPKASFFALDLAQIQQRLSAMPWLESVAVRRYWPDGLEVTIKERQVLARWGKTELLDVHGQRFQPDISSDFLSENARQWPLLEGPEGQEQIVLKRYKSASQSLRSLGLRIAQLTQNSRGAWRLQLNNGLILKLGKIRFMPRLKRFVAVYPKTLQAQLATITEIDLRYSRGLAVRWQTTLSRAPELQAPKASLASQVLPPKLAAR